jgi:acyl carrier protein
VSVDDMTINKEIRRVLAERAALGCDVEGLTDAHDLYAAGMTSFASVNVMLELEEAFDIEFPDRLLKRAVFATVASIGEAVSELLAERAA